MIATETDVTTFQWEIYEEEEEEEEGSWPSSGNGE
jgi:hypothetical protein